MATYVNEQLPFTVMATPYMYALTLFPPYLCSTHVGSGVLLWKLPRAAADRPIGTVDRVWVPTKYTKPLSTTARRRTRPLPPRSGPRGGRRRRRVPTPHGEVETL